MKVRATLALVFFTDERDTLLRETGCALCLEKRLLISAILYRQFWPFLIGLGDGDRDFGSIADLKIVSGHGNNPPEKERPVRFSPELACA